MCKLAARAVTLIKLRFMETMWKNFVLLKRNKIVTGCILQRSKRISISEQQTPYLGEGERKGGGIEMSRDKYHM